MPFLPLTLACEGTVEAPFSSTGGAGLRTVVPPLADVATVAASPACTSKPVGVSAPMRALTQVQYANSVTDLFGGLVQPSSAYPQPSGTSVTGFHSDLALNAPASGFAEAVLGAAEDAAREVLGRLPQLLPCAASGGRGCAAQFVETYATRAFRRPLDTAERGALLAQYDAAMAAHGRFDVAIAELTATLLSHPLFLYLPEIGAPEGTARKLDGYELASRLSYLLWDGPPDAELLRAAAAGALGSEAGLRAQAERMIESPRFEPVLARFTRDWIGIEDLTVGSKDPSLYPQLDATLARSLATELDRFVLRAVRRREGGVAELLTGRTTEVDAALASLYGAPQLAGEGFREVTLGAERAGLLTRGAVLAGLSGAFEASHVKRGKFVLSGLLCEAVGAPPPNALTAQPTYAPSTTRRQRSEILQQTSSCGGCHKRLDPVGLALDDFDALGRHLGAGIDVRGELVGASDVTGPFAGAGELSARLAESETVKQCLGRHWFRYAFGRVEQPADACTFAQTAASLLETEGDLAALFAKVATTGGFRLRTVEGE